MKKVRSVENLSENLVIPIVKRRSNSLINIIEPLVIDYRYSDLTILARGNILVSSEPIRICGQLVQNIIGSLRFAPRVLEHCRPGRLKPQPNHS